MSASSPPLAADDASRRTVLAGGAGHNEGAPYAITGECERLFCDSMRALFLGEGTTVQNGSRVMGTSNAGSAATVGNGKKDPSSSRRGGGPVPGIVQHWLVVWDYIGSASFRGFVVNRRGEKDMFVFFDRATIVQDLKPGYVFGFT